jgi:uncharacterized protein YraI
MFRKYFITGLLITVLSGVFWLSLATPAQADGYLQQPTIELPTVTGTPSGPIVTVNLDQDQINVRSGPNTSFPKVGVLLAGQQSPGLGRSPGGEWILIVYPGVSSGSAWVYAPLVTVTGGDLNVVEIPPTPTLLYTATVDPTLAAQFIVTSVPTRLPTFPAPAPLSVPTFTAPVSAADSGGMPTGLIVMILLIVGGLGGVISVLRGS